VTRCIQIVPLSGQFKTVISQFSQWNMFWKRSNLIGVIGCYTKELWKPNFVVWIWIVWNAGKMSNFLKLSRLVSVHKGHQSRVFAWFWNLPDLLKEHICITIFDRVVIQENCEKWIVLSEWEKYKTQWNGSNFLQSFRLGPIHQVHQSHVFPNLDSFPICFKFTFF